MSADLMAIYWRKYPTLLDARQTAAVMGKTETAVAGLLRRDSLAGYKISGTWLVAQDDIRGHLDETAERRSRGHRNPADRDRGSRPLHSELAGAVEED